MTRHLSARAKLTLLYTSLFAVCGAVLVAVTYSLLAHNLQKAPQKPTGAEIATAIENCVKDQTAKGFGADAKIRCGQLYAKGVAAGATGQRDATLQQLLTYSLLTLAGVTVLAAVAGWLVAGRILRPVQQLTTAARNANEANLTQRLGLQGSHDELRELADTFDDMLERLDRAFTAQRQFIANAGHELRTPLTVMRTSLDVVLARPAPTVEDLSAMATEVRVEVTRAEQLIDALLTLARSERPLAQSHRLDLALLVEEALEESRRSDLETTTSLSEAPVLGDPVLLGRLVGNLLDNAQQYNIPGGRIAVSTGNVNGGCEVRVVNTGPVIPPADVDRLFEPFTRLDDRTRHDGFGLGLALVHAVARAHHGTVFASAVPTGGLDVSVNLPLDPTLTVKSVLVDSRPDR